MDLKYSTLNEILKDMEMSYLESYLSHNGVDINTFLNLSPSQIPVLFPTPSFTIGDQLKFMHKYKSFMVSNKLDIKSAFLESFPCTSLTSPSSCTSIKATLNSSPVIDQIFDTDILDISDISQSSTHRSKSRLQESSRSSDLSQNIETSSNLSIETIESLPTRNLIKDIPKPLLDKSKIGNKRRSNIKASTEVEEIDLHELLKSDTKANGVIIGYSKSGILNENDRKIIVETIIKWLLQITNFPQHRHYEIIANKICDQFPTEETSIYYIPPKTEGEKQLLAKGKLPTKVKNAKSWLRKKGAISPSRKKNKIQNKDNIASSIDDILSDEIKAAQEWLKRNREPFEDVLENWKICQKIRLKNLIANKKTSTQQYIDQWLNILQQPQGYKLILDDFNSLHSVIDKYACLEGKQNNILVKWPIISEKLKQLVILHDDIVHHNDVKDFEPYLQNNNLSNDIKDYILLNVLSAICKPTGRVKVGKKVFKPSMEEAREAFIQQVFIGGDVLNAVKRRNEHYASISAAVQPYIIVVGNIEDSITAVYVCINSTLWKAGSVLQAVDICFKSFFALDAEYQVEAYHLWLFIQRALYDIYLIGERSVTNVTTLISRLNQTIC